MINQNIEKMKTCELMSYLKESIRDYKYAMLSYEEYMQLEDSINYALERLESESVLLVLPFKLQLGRF